MWDATADTDGYLFCWSYDPLHFNHAYCQGVGVPELDVSPLHPLWAIENLPSGAVLYIQVYAYNTNGISDDGRPLHSAPY